MLRGGQCKEFGEHGSGRLDLEGLLVEEEPGIAKVRFRSFAAPTQGISNVDMLHVHVHATACACACTCDVCM